jgi:formylglycine-generating enzyme required for sulfatase activity
MIPRPKRKISSVLLLICVLIPLIITARLLIQKYTREEEPEDNPPPRPGPIDPVATLYGNKTSLSQKQAQLYASIIQDIAAGLPKVKAETSDMIRIPAGPAVIGAREHPHGQQQRLTQQTLNLPAYYIDKTEVTNVQYKKCVDQGHCLSASGSPHIQGHDGPNNPAILTFMQAKRYCLYRGKRLPTEHEWEKAARGSDGRLYPWGNEKPDATRANICGEECPSTTTQKDWIDPYPGTAPVGSFPAGTSPYGLLDVAGNVKEWVESATPLKGSQKIARGASWYSDRTELLVYYRQVWFPSTRIDDKGVRCAVDGE